MIRNPWVRLVLFLVAMAVVAAVEGERVRDAEPPHLQQFGGAP